MGRDVQNISWIVFLYAMMNQVEMKNLPLMRAIVIIHFLISTHLLFAQELITYKQIATYSADQLNTFWKKNNIPKIVVHANNGIAIYELIYSSTHWNGERIIASGLAYVPLGTTQPSPLILYNHGSEIEKERRIEIAGETGICMGYAADGYVVISPDYFGIAMGEGEMLYMHLTTEAQCGYDLLRASQKFFEDINFACNHQLFLTGYSQGAHASVALLLQVEKQPLYNFQLVAASPMSGPYNLEFTVLDGGERKYAYPSFFMMLLKTYNYLVNTKPDIRDLLIAPLDSIIPPIMDGKHSLEFINSFLPDTPFRALQPAFVQAFQSDSLHSFRQFLRENSLHRSIPVTPLQLCYCDGDKIANKQNTLQWYHYLLQHHKTNVTLKRAGRKFNHWHCAYFTIVYTKMFFDLQRSDRPPPSHIARQKALLNLGKLFVKK